MHYHQRVLWAVLAIAFLSTGCGVVVKPIRAEGRAMAPTIEDNERLLGSLLITSLDRGDIVGFKYPKNEAKSFVKRIVGLPGEQIQMTNGRVSINGRPLAEPYISDDYRSADTWGPVTIGGDEYFMLGDNRKNSADSRHWGVVKRRLIWTKVIGK